MLAVREPEGEPELLPVPPRPLLAEELPEEEAHTLAVLELDTEPLLLREMLAVELEELDREAEALLVS